MNRFVQDSVYTRADVLAAIGEHKLDGPFVVGEKSVALFVNLGDGPDDPHLEDRSTLRWPRAAPVQLTERDVSTLLNRAARDHLLGRIRITTKPPTITIRPIGRVFRRRLERHDAAGVRAADDLVAFTARVQLGLGDLL